MTFRQTYVSVRNKTCEEGLHCIKKAALKCVINRAVTDIPYIGLNGFRKIIDIEGQILVVSVF